MFGILSLEVASNKRDLGLRLALGAKTKNIVMWTMNRIKWPLLAGTAFTVICSLLMHGAMMEAFHLPLALLTSAVLAGMLFVAIIVILAATLPLWNALSISPADSIRQQI